MPQPFGVQQGLQASRNALNSALGTPGKTGERDLGKQDFMKLLISQMTNQDPLDPMDAAGMMNQLSQLGTIEQLVSLNKKLDSMQTAQEAQNRFGAAAYLGRDVTTKGDRISYMQGTQSDLRFSLSQPAKSARVHVLDSQGARIRSMQMGALAAGVNTYPWDGKTDQGRIAPSGEYRFSVNAIDATDRLIESQTHSLGRVSGVRFEGNDTFLWIDGREVDAREVVEVSNQSVERYGQRMPLPAQQQLQPAGPIQNISLPQGLQPAPAMDLLRTPKR